MTSDRHLLRDAEDTVWAITRRPGVSLETVNALKAVLREYDRRGVEIEQLRAETVRQNMENTRLLVENGRLKTERLSTLTSIDAVRLRAALTEIERLRKEVRVLNAEIEIYRAERGQS